MDRSQSQIRRIIVRQNGSMGRVAGLKSVKTGHKKSEQADSMWRVDLMDRKCQKY